MKITRNLWLLSLTSLLNDISSEMVFPLLGFIITQRLGASYAVVGVVEGIAETVASTLKFYTGRWSDRIKRRKPFAVGGYAASWVGKLCLAAATVWGFALAGRVFDKIGKAIRTAPRDALIAESVPKDQRGGAFGFHRSMDTIGAALGVAGAWIIGELCPGEKAYGTALWVSLIPAIISIGVLMMIKEHASKPASHEHAGDPAPAAPPVPRLLLGWRSLDHRLRTFLVVAVVFALAQSSDVFLLLRLHDAGASIAQTLLIYLGFNIVYAFAGYPAGRLSDALGRRGILLVGIGLYAIVYAGFAVLHSSIGQTPGAAPEDNLARTLVWGTVLMLLYGLSRGCTEGVTKALLTDRAPKDAKASIIGLHDMLTGLTLFPASWLAGLAWVKFGSPAPFWLGAGCAAAAAVILAIARSPKQQPPPAIDGQP